MPDTPFWETIAASVVASSLLSSLLTVLFERRRQNKNLELEGMKKALSILREDYDELVSVFTRYTTKGEGWTLEQGLSWKRPHDIWTSLYLCSPHLAKEIEAYVDARFSIMSSLTSSITNPVLRKQLAIESRAILSSLAKPYDVILKDMVSRWRKQIGFKKSLKELWHNISLRVWGLDK
jgi:hypothetical protein